MSVRRRYVFRFLLEVIFFFFFSYAEPRLAYFASVQGLYNRSLVISDAS